MSRRSVQGKVALITGAGSGINYEFAKLLLSKGCSVMIGDLAVRPEAQALLDQYPLSSQQQPEAPNRHVSVALFHKTDVRSWPQLSALWAATLSAFSGRCDIVVPGAGLFEPAWSSFWQAPRTPTNQDSPSRDGDSDGGIGHYALLDVNLVHPIRLSQLAIGHWTTQKQQGDLIHVSSMAGRTAFLAAPMYIASKHGINGFVKSLGALRDSLGIRVSAVAPGAVNTPMWADDPTKASISDGGKDIALGPEEIALGMLELFEDPALGDGTILEVSLGKRFVVPLYTDVPPTIDPTPIDYGAQQERLLAGIKEHGLKV
ncbi:NAD-dependent 15-hydroxyprostaglandin dehydrogenase [Microdochium bolleyi]|uniref:NAD-dependent 15-hydroxyprostaglandin dehydrogenase n=1 Tax=Microdochium bolleyi TaxID=196109 RepID=A0A136J9R7_9PEZI|nr:NAD-dependent 15-hydroxyprostaglandin dehydrogenase [Microdochium bolleyi]